MIQFIDLGKQIYGTRKFALWNTVSNQFLDYNGSQVWRSTEELEYDLRGHLGPGQAKETFERISCVLADWVPKTVNRN